jgi:hypothetical protein
MVTRSPCRHERFAQRPTAARSAQARRGGRRWRSGLLPPARETPHRKTAGGGDHEETAAVQTTGLRVSSRL